MNMLCAYCVVYVSWYNTVGSRLVTDKNFRMSLQKAFIDNPSDFLGKQ